jgi:hypothetical protein
VDHYCSEKVSRSLAWRWLSWPARPKAPKFQSSDVTGSSFGREFSLQDPNGKTRTLAISAARRL